ncbi:MAG: autotransporter assembly complex family protein [Gammaproteobacteria bacterium]
MPRWLVPVLLPWLAGVASAAGLTVNVEGLPKELKEAVEGQISLRNYASRDVTPAQVRRLFNNAETEIRSALEPYGYYNAQVASSLQTTDKGLTALFRVTPGEQVKVVSKKVTVEGEAAQLGPVRRAVRRFKPDEGEPLNHGVYEQSKADVETALLSNGFLKMKPIKPPRVEVTRKANTATIDLEYQSGPRMKFGAVHFSKVQFPPEFLERYIPWEPGAFYSPDELLAFQQRLVDADYFATVSVQPDLGHSQGLDVPINVELSPAKRTIYTAGAYVSTDTGPGVKVGMQRRWVNDSGHKFQADIDYAQRLQAYSTSYRIPLPGPNDKSLNFGVTHRNEDTVTSQSNNDRAAINETQKWHGFTRTVGLQYLAGTYDIADEHHNSQLLYGEATLTRKQANDYFFPRRGWSLAFGVRFAPESLLSDTSFSQVTADGKYIFPLGSAQRVLLRLSLGTMIVDDFDRLPPELRFFAGGDRSIRGFDYQDLGSLSPNSTPQNRLVVGGTNLAVGSIELERYFLPKWGAAVFVDGGDAWRTGEFALNIGAGIGLRWRSPVGVVRLDVAKPVKSDLADAIRFHITIGPDL